LTYRKKAERPFPPN